MRYILYGLVPMLLGCVQADRAAEVVLSPGAGELVGTVGALLPVAGVDPVTASVTTAAVYAALREALTLYLYLRNKNKTVDVE